jgi:hypothetical protein
MSETKELRVPCRKYWKPHGRSQNGWLIIPDGYSPERQLMLDVIAHEGIWFTIEDMDFYMVNLCMDDGTFDYVYQVIGTDKVNDAVLKLIDEFDVHRYRQHYQMHSQS